MSTLADYWAVLSPELPSAWDTPGNRANLTQVVQRMAPIPRIGMECRLGDAVPTLDLQQCVDSGDGEPALLRDFVVGKRAPGEREDPGAVLQRFCTTWADPTTLLHQQIGEVFLEYDLDSARRASLSPTPSLFLALGDAVTTPATRRSLAEKVLALVLPAPESAGVVDNVVHCLAACPPGAYVGYLGVMLGRATAGLRVNVKRLGPDDVVPFLGAVDWPGSMPPVVDWVAWAYDHADQVTICLDVGETVFPQLALECGLALQPEHEPRWEAVLDELTGAGLCTPQNAAAFLSVPNSLSPPDAPGEWPATWIAASLCSPSDWFSTTERRLSHLKLTLGDQHLASAAGSGGLASAAGSGGVVIKGYWGAGHVWRRVGPRGEEEVEVRRRVPPAVHDQPEPLAPADAIDEALARGVAFLLSRQAHTGRWSDFLLPAGPSDEWVTAFVAAWLLDASPDTAYVAADRAWRALLNRHRDEGGWGYNRLTPADADSTSWALRLAGRLQALDERVAAARRFLDEHVVSDGGVTTYAKGDPIRRYTRLPEGASLDGWHAAHACVTAAAAPLLGATVASHLAREQQADGRWQGYWWWDDEYATALAAEALMAHVPAGSTSRAVSWAQSRVGITGAVQSTDRVPSPWATAWCVRLLGLGTAPGARADRARAVQWLVEAQQPDGSWRASARLRVPAPAQLDPAGRASVMTSLDQNRLFTTAAAVAALGLCRSR